MVWPNVKTCWEPYGVRVSWFYLIKYSDKLYGTGVFQVARVGMEDHQIT